MKELPLDVTSDGLRLAGSAYVSDRADRTVVLMHGIPTVAPPDPNDAGYRGLAQTFAEREWVAGWADMRGARESEGYFSIEGWVRDVAAIVEATRAIHPTRFVALVGSSAGGAVSVEAVARGLQVDALALLASPAEWVSFAADPLAGVRRVVQEAGMPVAPEVLEDPRGWAEEFDRVVPERAIKEIDVPIWIAHGDHDDVVPVDHAARLAAAAPNAVLEIVTGGAHQLRRDPTTVGRLIDWIESVSRA